MNWIINRIKEPSTWAGMAAIMQALGHATAAGQAVTIGQMVVAVLGAVACVVPEKTTK